MDISQDYFSPLEAARILGLSTERVRQLAQAGVLSAIETPLGKLFPKSIVEQYAEVRQQRLAEKAVQNGK